MGDVVWTLGMLGLATVGTALDFLGLPGGSYAMILVSTVALAALLGLAVWGYRRAGRLRLA